ncbi:MAG TPA: efflux RND transporter periplasmic adaptor subunit [Candidatus Koribacter sp.]|jgi:RND family efflux transporter MFP subunit
MKTTRIVIGALLLGLSLSACKKSEKEPTPEVDVQAEPAATADITVHVQGDAVLFPMDQAAITPKVSSPVRKFFVQRGSRVHKGELLARLEARDVAAAEEDANGSYQQAHSAYLTATRASVPEDYQKAELDFEQAKTNLEVQQKVFDARQNLFKQGAIPGRDLDTARVNLVQAQSAFNEAQKHFESAKAVTREEAMRNAEGQLKSAQGKLRGAQAAVSYTEIRSPIDGVVTERPYYEGEMAVAGTPLITVMEISSLLAKSHLPQTEAQQLKIGSPAAVTIAGIDKPIEGKVTLVSPALDPGSTTMEVWIKIPNQDGALKPGTAARVSIAAETIKNALAVPVSAVLKDDEGKNFVMVVEGGKAKKHEVTTGVSNGDDIQVSSGIKAGDQVITTGAYGLDDNTKVKIVSGDEKKEDSETNRKSGDKD